MIGIRQSRSHAQKGRITSDNVHYDTCVEIRYPYSRKNALDMRRGWVRMFVHAWQMICASRSAPAMWPWHWHANRVCVSVRICADSANISTTHGAHGCMWPCACSVRLRDAMENAQLYQITQSWFSTRLVVILLLIGFGYGHIYAHASMLHTPFIKTKCSHWCALIGMYIPEMRAYGYLWAVAQHSAVYDL